MTWIIVIIIIAIIIFAKYNSDKSRLRNNISNSGGMKQIFEPFLEKVESKYGNLTMLKLTENEIEFSSDSSKDTKIFWGIKYGFSGIASFKADLFPNKNHINAISVVTAGVNRQLECLNSIENDLRAKGIL